MTVETIIPTLKHIQAPTQSQEQLLWVKKLPIHVVPSEEPTFNSEMRFKDSNYTIRIQLTSQFLNQE